MPVMEELAASTCWEMLRSMAVGRVALRTGADDVDVFPINYVVDHGTIVFRTAPGTKLDHIGDRPRVTFEVDNAGAADNVVWSVVAKGPAQIVHQRDDVIDAFELDVTPWHAGPKPVFVRLSPDDLSGRRFTRKEQ